METVSVKYFKPFSQGNVAFEKCFIIISSILMIKKKKFVFLIITKLCVM